MASCVSLWVDLGYVYGTDEVLSYLRLRALLVLRFFSFRYCPVPYSNMIASIIIHNMIVKSERDADLVFDQYRNYEDPLVEPHQGVPTEFAQFLANHDEIIVPCCFLVLTTSKNSKSILLISG